MITWQVFFLFVSTTMYVQIKAKDGDWRGKGKVYRGGDILLGGGGGLIVHVPLYLNMYSALRMYRFTWL